MIEQQYHKWIVLAVLIILIFALINEKLKPSLLFLGVALLLVLSDIMQVQVLIESLANQQILTVFLVVMCSSIIQQNFDLNVLLDKIFSGSRTGKSFLVRMQLIVAMMSSMFNNTPIVVMMMPYVYQKAKDLNVSPSKLLLPLSFSAILGGMITLVGTSTNLVLNGLLESNQEEIFRFSDFFVLGVSVTFLGVGYFYFIGFNILKNRVTLKDEVKEHVRSYFVEIKLTENSYYIGRATREKKIRDVQGVNLIEIIRGNELINVVTALNVTFQKGDRLIFTGSLSDILNLVENDQNLELAKNPKFQIDDKLRIAEAILPANSSIEGKRIKETSFRKDYYSTIIAVHRNGEELSGRIGEIKLRRGDLLLLAISEMANMKVLQKDFYLLSKRQAKEEKYNRYKSHFFVGILLLIILSVVGVLSLFKTLLLVVGGALVTKLTSVNRLRQDIDYHLLVILVVAVALGQVFISSGAANLVSETMINILLPYGEVIIIIAVMLLTVLLTSFITNVAAVSVAFPIAYALGQKLEISAEPIYLGIAFAASAAFLTPIGYQTNLIVSGPGGYKMRDFLMVGAPFLFLYLIVVITYISFHYNLI